MHMSWPQGILAALMVSAWVNGARKVWVKDGWIDMIAVSCGVGAQFGLLWWGGFWK